MARAKLAFTSSAEMLWSGDLRDDFREMADGIVGGPLSDDAWAGLKGVVRSYAMLLAHEHGAVGLSEQVEAVDKASKACAGFIEALELIETPPFGGLLTGLVTDKWEEGRGREREAAHNHRAMARDIDALDAIGAVQREDEGGQPSLGWDLIRAWQVAGRLELPAVGADLLVQLREVQEALKMTAAELRSERLYKSTKDDAFIEFVGLLDEWQKLHGLGLGATKQSAYGSYGRLTALVKALVGEVPLLLDTNGKQMPKQIRRHIHTDGALAEAILIARKEYRSHQ